MGGNVLGLSEVPTQAPLLLYGANASCGRELELIRETASTVGIQAVILASPSKIEHLRKYSSSSMLVFLGWQARLDEVHFLRHFRHLAKHSPILVVAARSDPRAKAVAFSIGADNYLDPGFLRQELEAKIKRLRNLSAVASLRAPILVGDVQIWPEERVVLQSGRRVPLSHRELSMLICLAQRSPHPVSREQLEREAFGLRHDPGTNVVAVHVHRLRKKFEASGDLLQTVPGEGYKFG